MKRQSILFIIFIILCMSIALTANAYTNQFVNPPLPGLPTIEINFPTNISTYSTTLSSINIAGNATSGQPIVSVTWRNDRGGSGTCAGTFSWYVNNITLQSGTNIITVEIKDSKNNIATDTLTVTANANIVSLSGYVNLSNYEISKISSVPVTFEFIKADGSKVTKIINLASDGSFRINNITPGVYNVAVKASHWLRKIEMAVNLLSDYDEFDLNLINGDCNNDNQIDEGDFGLLSAAWYSSIAEIKFNDKADLNGDGSIDEGDFGLLSAAWYQSGN